MNTVLKICGVLVLIMAGLNIYLWERNVFVQETLDASYSKFDSLKVVLDQLETISRYVMKKNVMKVAAFDSLHIVDFQLTHFISSI